MMNNEWFRFARPMTNAACWNSEATVNNAPSRNSLSAAEKAVASDRTDRYEARIADDAVDLLANFASGA
jgi:hypothetical protein